MREAFIQWATVTLCAAIVVGSICRLDMLHARTHKAGWIAMFTLAPIFAGGVAVELLEGGHPPWYVVAGLVAWLLQLINTRALWIHGTPASTMKDPP